MKQMRQLLDQNNLIRYISAEIEAGFANISASNIVNISYDIFHH